MKFCLITVIIMYLIHITYHQLQDSPYLDHHPREKLCSKQKLQLAVLARRYRKCLTSLLQINTILNAEELKEREIINDLAFRSSYVVQS